VSCPVCGAARTRGKLRKGDIEILECPVCGLAFWTPPADFRPTRVYDAAYFAGGRVDRGYDDYGDLEASLRLNFARRLARIPLPGSGARLLDVGAAYGFAVDEARRAGWDATGLEISAPAARRGAAVARGRVVVADAAAAPFANGRFDAVTLWDVLEHLPDPHAAVSEMARLLRPGGRLALSTGDVGSWLARASGARWHLYTIPEHVFFYTRPSLRALLEAHGFRVVSMRAEGATYTLGYLVERVRKTLLGRPARRSPRWPGSGLRVPVNLFDIVTAQAVRGSGP
jgi:SAM-dependent methyltransferase